MNTPTYLPTVDEVEQFAPEVWELTDRYVAETLAGHVDFDLEAFDALDALLQGETDAVVLAKISPEHPASTEAYAMLQKRLRERNA